MPSEAMIGRATSAFLAVRGNTVTMDQRMAAAIAAALPTPEENERGIDAAFEAFDHFRGSHKAMVREAISAYLAATGMNRDG